ncbi:hypothetical protein AYO37_00475 [Opitutia bacterium SCGC AG-212-L18]|nr:hypothetical protein AYO37_00475 [Opitutae bacterium SCGC AG-212-L18]
MQAISDQILSVSAFNKEVKLILETNLAPKWVRGEISNLRKQGNGHIYFTLKDATSQLSCVLFKSNAVRQSIEIKEGQQILVYGEINVYEPRGNYQLIIAIVLADGQGKLQIEFEQLKQKLAAEGLFESSRKKEIPVLPKTIAIITSPTGAAIRDFISVLKRRDWSGHLIILPAKVQGNDAAAEIVDQINHAAQMRIFDLLVICRGGGSLEDLWPFNEEILVRAIAQCPIPIISGVGHEIDFTLADFAADLRAETPTAAAEVISSNFIKIKNRLQSAVKDLKKSTDFITNRYHHYLTDLAHRLKAQSPQNYIYHLNLKLDDIANRIASTAQKEIFIKKENLNKIKTRLLALSPQNKINLLNERLHQIQKRLISNSIDSGLKRGFVLLENANGTYITRKKNLKEQKGLHIRFADGEAPIAVQLTQQSMSLDFN